MPKERAGVQMRTEKEMFDIIINTAKSDDRVLAAYLKGSRANPNVPRDIYQDYDIMYVVKETESFRADLSWMNAFGNIILKQELFTLILRIVVQRNGKLLIVQNHNGCRDGHRIGFPLAQFPELIPPFIPGHR